MRLVPQVLHLDRKDFFLQFVLVQPDLQINAPFGYGRTIEVRNRMVRREARGVRKRERDATQSGILPGIERLSLTIFLLQLKLPEIPLWLDARTNILHHAHLFLSVSLAVLGMTFVAWSCRSRLSFSSAWARASFIAESSSCTACSSRASCLRQEQMFDFGCVQSE